MKKILILLGCIGIALSHTAYAQDPNFHIYLCFGQSNMEGMGTIETQDRTTNARVRMLQNQTCSNLNRTYGTWYTAAPPLSRCWNGLGPSDYFGKAMADGMPSSVTIGLVNTSYSGCDIAFFQKGAPLGKASTNNGAAADIPSQFIGGYAWMLDLAKKAQTVGVIKGIIFHQGETNTNDQSWKTKVQGIVNNLRADLGIGNVPFLVGELLYAQYGACCSSHNTEINKLPSLVTNCAVITASGLPGKDEAHFTSASYRELGKRYAQKMLTFTDTKTCCGRNAQNGFAYCCTNSDPDGDGWGWENESSCIIPGSIPDVEKCGSMITGFIQEESELEKVAYPNPFSHSLNIRLESPFEYSILSASGLHLEGGQGIGKKEVAHSLPKGLYLFQIQSNRTSKTIKIVKTKYPLRSTKCFIGSVLSIADPYAH